MVLPDGLAELAIAIVAGILGFLGRSVMELKSRVAVVEHKTDDIRRVEAKLDRLDAKLDDLAIKFAGAAGPLNRARTNGERE